MSIPHTDPRTSASSRESLIPSAEQLFSSKPSSLKDVTTRVQDAFKTRTIHLDPLPLPEDSHDLQRFVKLFRAQLPDPLRGPSSTRDTIIACTHGDWYERRIDSFIASMTLLRRASGLPRFKLYSASPPPPEISFLFETDSAGLLEISAWDTVEDQHINSEDCPELAEAGRDIIRTLYHVDLDPGDLQWLSVVNQIIIEELRWFSDDPNARLNTDIDYIPFASLVLLGCIAGETVRLNHNPELLWADADGENWPRLAKPSAHASLPLIDVVFKRFETGQEHDVWETYQHFYTSQHLSPPESFLGDIDNNLDVIPDWDPSPNSNLSDAVQTFQNLCEEHHLDTQPHPFADSLPEPLQGFLHAETSDLEEQPLDLFVTTQPWTPERTEAFLRTFGHRSLEDWEIAFSPVFAFFSAHPLPEPLEYSFIQGPPIAPLEGLARVETPSPNLPPTPGVIEPLVHWLLSAMERYTTIGLTIDSLSVLPGLEFLVREDLAQNDEEPGDSSENPFEPIALLVAVGITAGECYRLNQPDDVSCTWDFTSLHTSDQGQWPRMQRTRGFETRTIDWVEAARAIWRGDTDEFGISLQ